MLVLTIPTWPTSLIHASIPTVMVAQISVLPTTVLTLALAQLTVLLVLTAPTLPTSSIPVSTATWTAARPMVETPVLIPPIKSMKTLEWKNTHIKENMETKISHL